MPTIPHVAATRVVVVTANVLLHEERRARAASFDGFIGKPLDPLRFPDQVAVLLHGERGWRAR